MLYTLAFHRDRWREIVLLVSSYTSYMSWNSKYGGLLAFSTVVDYLVGRLIVREQRRRALIGIPWSFQEIVIADLSLSRYACLASIPGSGHAEFYRLYLWSPQSNRRDETLRCVLCDIVTRHCDSYSSDATYRKRSVRGFWRAPCLSRRRFTQHSFIILRSYL